MVHTFFDRKVCPHSSHILHHAKKPPIKSLKKLFCPIISLHLEAVCSLTLFLLPFVVTLVAQQVNCVSCSSFFRHTGRKLVALTTFLIAAPDTKSCVLRRFHTYHCSSFLRWRFDSFGTLLFSNFSNMYTHDKSSFHVGASSILHRTNFFNSFASWSRLTPSSTERTLLPASFLVDVSIAFWAKSLPAIAASLDPFAAIRVTSPLAANFSSFFHVGVPPVLPHSFHALLFIQQFHFVSRDSLKYLHSKVFRRFFWQDLFPFHHCEQCSCLSLMYLMLWLNSWHFYSCVTSILECSSHFATLATKNALSPCKLNVWKEPSMLFSSCVQRNVPDVDL